MIFIILTSPSKILQCRFGVLAEPYASRPGEPVKIDPKYLDVVAFVSGLGFGLVAFTQIAYPLVTLIPKVRRLLEENRHERSVLVSLLLIAPAIWLIVLASTIVLV